MPTTEDPWTDDGRRWLAERPPAVQAKVLAYPPWGIYRLESTGQHCHIASYSEREDGSCEMCQVNAWLPDLPPELTLVGVFGIRFAELTRIDSGITPQPPEVRHGTD